MGRLVEGSQRWVVAVLLVLAAAAGAVLPCLCAPVPASAHAHDCCVPSAGIRAAAPSCCDGHAPRTSTTWTPAAVATIDAPLVNAAPAVAALPAALPDRVAPQRPVSASPPLRI